MLKILSGAMNVLIIQYHICHHLLAIRAVKNILKF